MTYFNFHKLPFCLPSKYWNIYRRFWGLRETTLSDPYIECTRRCAVLANSLCIYFNLKTAKNPLLNFLVGDWIFLKAWDWKSRFFFFFMLRLQLALSRLRWKRWNFHWAVRAGSPCILAPHLSLLIADLRPGSHHLIFLWPELTHLLPDENRPVFLVSLYWVSGYAAHCAGLRTSLGSWLCVIPLISVIAHTLSNGKGTAFFCA